MEEFTLKGDSGFLKITFKKVWGFPKITSHFGGYEVQCSIEIESSGFSVTSSFYTTTGELFDFYSALALCNEKIQGIVEFNNYEDDLKLKIAYDVLGHVNVRGNFSLNRELDNSLSFEFTSDQSYIQSTLTELRTITEKYGGMGGVK